MTQEEKEIIERFCRELTAHDAWMWKLTCRHILNDIDYSAPTTTKQDGNFYSFKGVMNNGQTIRAGYQDGGFYIDWGKPVIDLSVHVCSCGNSLPMKDNFCARCGHLVTGGENEISVL